MAGYIKQNPFTGNRKALWIPEPERKPNIVEPQDFRRLLAGCRDDRWKAICTIAYCGGLRRGEIVALKWDEVDFDNKILQVINTEEHSTKSRRIRTVPMTIQVISALRLLQRGVFSSKHVFTNTAGRPMFNNFHGCFKRIVRRAGLVDEHGKARFSIHDLRRSCATELLRCGVSPKTVQKILGHSNLATTMKYYVGVEDKDLTDAARRLEIRRA